MTLLEQARQGKITEEMKLAAAEENISAELLRENIAKGTAIICKNKKRPNGKPLAVGAGLRTKVNANIGTSKDDIGIDKELEKARVAVAAGADAIMDLSTGGPIDEIRAAIISETEAFTGSVPLYMWRNVGARSQWQPDKTGGYFLKMGYAGGEKWMTGHMYIFHNTVFRSDEWLPTGGLGGNRIVKHAVSRNNILHVLSPENRCVSDNERNVDNDYDYDLFNGRIPPGVERHGVRGEPIYAEGAGVDAATLSGHFQLAPKSPGAGAGLAIPNFSDGYAGDAPDVGAHQRGTPPIQYGVRAGR